MFLNKRIKAIAAITTLAFAFGIAPVHAAGGVWGEVTPVYNPIYKDQYTTVEGSIDKAFLKDKTLNIKTVSITVSRNYDRNDFLYVQEGVAVDQKTGKFKIEDLQIGETGQFVLDAWYGNPYDTENITVIAQHDQNYFIDVTAGLPLVASVNVTYSKTLNRNMVNAMVKGNISGLPYVRGFFPTQQKIRMVVGNKCGYPVQTIMLQVSSPYKVGNSTNGRFMSTVSLRKSCLYVARYYYNNQQIRGADGEFLVQYLGQ